MERKNGYRTAMGLMIGLVLGGAAVSWMQPWSAEAQGPARLQRWSYECERVATNAVTVGQPVFRDDHPATRALHRRDEQDWELVTASHVSPGVTFFCWRRPR